MAGICAKCGAPLQDGSNFCTNCGAAVGGAEELKLMPLDRPADTDEKRYIKVSDSNLEETQLIPKENIPSDTAYIPPVGQSQNHNNQPAAGRTYYGQTSCGQNVNGPQYYGQQTSGQSNYSQQYYGQNSGQHYGQSYDRNSVRKTSSHRGIKLLLLLIAFLLGWNGYLMMSSRSEPVRTVQEQAQTPAREQEKSQSAPVQAKEKKVEKKSPKISYIEHTVASLSSNEETLADLASKINSGKYAAADLLNYDKQAKDLIQKRYLDLQKQFAIDDPALKREAEELFSLQVRRVECMRQGIMGNQEQYGVGSRYYDQFQERYESLKQRITL